MRMALAVIGTIATLGASVSSCSEAKSEEIVLQNGVVLKIPNTGRLQDGCHAFGQVSHSQDIVCVEFPASAISKEFEPLNWYSRELQRAGFEWASSAANQYWFN